MRIATINGKIFESNDWKLCRTSGGVNYCGGMVFYKSEKLKVAVPVHAIAYIEDYDENIGTPFDGD